jgi:hypothetical protein
VRIITANAISMIHLGSMSTNLIDATREIGSLRRAAILLERVRQDGAADLETLSAGVSTIQRLTCSGCPIHRAAIQHLQAVLCRMAPAATPPPIGRPVGEILRWNALVETRDLLDRLSRASRVPSLARTAGRTLASQ